MCVCVCVCVCVFVCVCCGTLKKKREKKVCGFKKRLRVCIQNVPVYAGTTRTCVSHMCAWCRHTRGRFERTQRDVLFGHTASRGSSSVLLTKICPRMVITCFRGSPKKLLDLSHFQV